MLQLQLGPSRPACLFALIFLRADSSGSVGGQVRLVLQGTAIGFHVCVACHRSTRALGASCHLWVHASECAPEAAPMEHQILPTLLTFCHPDGFFLKQQVALSKAHLCPGEFVTQGFRPGLGDSLGSVSHNQHSVPSEVCLQC